MSATVQNKFQVSSLHVGTVDPLLSGQYQEMPAMINVRYLTSYKPQMLATVQNKFLKAWVEQG